MANMYSVGDIVIPHVPEEWDPGDEFTYCWVDQMNEFAGKPWAIVKTENDCGKTVYLLDSVTCGRGGDNHFRLYDFWLTPANESNLSVNENDLTNLLEE